MTWHSGTSALVDDLLSIKLPEQSQLVLPNEFHCAQTACRLFR